MKLLTQITDYINACFTGIWIQTHEPDEAERELTKLAAEKGWHLLSWNLADGWHEKPAGVCQDPSDPLVPLRVLTEKAPLGTDDTTIMIVHNFHRFLTNVMVVQKLFNTILGGKERRAFVVVLSPVVQIPVELEKVFVTVEHELPDESALNTIAVDLCEGGVLNGCSASVRAAAGLTRYEAEGSFALSLARHGKLQPEEIWELKQSMIKKSGLLEMHRGQENFSNLGGLDALKSFCQKALASHGKKARPKGVLLLGVPGTGKSAFAKALGKETERPTLLLDIGALMGGIVGQTEENIRKALRIADAMAPCVLFIDEIEKALAGSTDSHQGDSGVSSRLLGTFLTWMNDHESDVFVVCTSNDISRLPPEFSRAERFDAIFFIDLPSHRERAQIWDLYMRVYDHPIMALPEDERWTGAEIRSCCRLASMLGVSLKEAAQNIVPVATTGADKIRALREWASGRCLSATFPGVYTHQPPKADAPRRRIAKDPVHA